MRNQVSNKLGFTLIEVIITLIIASLFGTMVLSYFNSGISESTEIINNMSTPLGIQGVMSKIVADYQNTSDFQSDLSKLETKISESLTESKNYYGIYPNYSVTMNNNYKFRDTDSRNSLMVTIKSNSSTSSESATYIFAKKIQ